ncbi:MAG: hypothetical protein HGA86_06595 [Anaerolineaceae bacterium]|nr:hypothetical protein [Anaerolineaceae bacterium]
MNQGFRPSNRRVVVVVIMLLIAALHFLRPGSIFTGDALNLYNSFFLDIIVPFGAYFLLCLVDEQQPIFRSWQVKLAAAFVIPAAAETLQYFGVPTLGSTFDPLDYGMYAIGAGLAALVDTQVFARVFKFWNRGKQSE